jgi:hypothetical protein
MSRKSPAPPKAPEQLNKFRDLARQLECDESEKAFEERLRKLAQVKLKPSKKDAKAK